MIDVSKILTSMLSGGTQQGGAGGLLGQIAGAAMQGGQTAQGGIGGLLGGLAGQAQNVGQQAPNAASGGLGGLFGQVATMAGQATQTAQNQAGGVIGQASNMAANAQNQAGGFLDQLTNMAQNAQSHAQTMSGQAQGGLGGLLAGLAGAATQAGQTAQGQAGGLLGGLSGALQNLQNQAGQAGGAAAGGLGGFLGQAAEILKNNAGGFAGGAAAGTLAGLLLGTGAGRAVAGTAARLGGLAVVGGLAYLALQNYQQGKPVVQGTINDVTGMLGMGQKPVGFADAAGSENETATILLRSMVAAAFADGEMTDQERTMIVGQLDAMGLNDEEKAYMDGLLAAPLDIQTIAAACVNDEMKAQAYLAAHLGMDVDTHEEAQFLADFANALGLDPQLVAHLDQAASEAKQQA